MTPLHQVLGMAQLIQCEVEQEKRAEYFGILMSAGEDLAEKLKSLVETSEGGSIRQSHGRAEKGSSA